MHTYTITHTLTYSYIQTYTHAYIHNHTYTYILIHTNVHTCIHTQSHIHLHTHTYKRTHMHTYTITRAHASAVPMEDFASHVCTTDTYVLVSLYACLYASVYGIMCVCVLILTNNNDMCMCSDAYKHTTKSIHKNTMVQMYKHTNMYTRTSTHIGVSSTDERV